MKIKQLILMILTILVFGVVSYKIYKKNIDNKINVIPFNNSDNSFDYNIIHLISENETNQLISPYSIAYALSILNEGAKGNTKDQINKVIYNYHLNNNLNIKNKIGIANALFIKDKYKNNINNEFITTIKNKYNSEILFDEFKNPNIINSWVNEKTYQMIDKNLENLDDEFTLGIANALAIDVEWERKFEPNLTYKDNFIKLDNTRKLVDMMSSKNDVKYIENKNAKGIIKSYEKVDDINLEFIAILPNNDLKTYINNFNKNEFNNLIKSQKNSNSNLDIYTSIPKFKFGYDYLNFKKDLIKLGIIDAFDYEKANFRNMINKDSNMDLYLDTALHKTFIDLNENGTKASAVTFFGMYATSALEQPKEEIIIKFNRPFLFIIKEKNSDNILFFGTIYEP